MSPFTVLVLFAQACLIQVVVSQCGCNNLGLSSVNLAPRPSLASSAVASSASCYGGEGKGAVSVLGDVIGCGETVVVGAVPAEGKAAFSGNVPATGAVSIAGQCGCVCA